MVTKSDIEAIIARGIKEQIPLTQAVGDMPMSKFYFCQRKYGLKLPEYNLRFTCEVCKKPYYISRHKGGSQSGSHRICPICKPAWRQQYFKDWRKAHPEKRVEYTEKHWRKSHSKGSKDKIINMVDGWTYNPKQTKRYGGICRVCTRIEKKLNKFGLCEDCYEWISSGLADPLDPNFYGGSHHKPVSEMTIKTVETPTMEG